MAEIFDDISRVVGSQLPRRRALKLIMGIFAGGAVGLLEASPTAALAPKGFCFEKDNCITPMTGGGSTEKSLCCDTLGGKSWCPSSAISGVSSCAAGQCQSCQSQDPH